MIVAGIDIRPHHTRAVKLLLWSWWDLAYEPPTATGQITRKAGAKRVAESDTAPTYSTRCDRCGGSGDWKPRRLPSGQWTRLCELCNGSGKRTWPRLQDPDTVTRDGLVDAITEALDRRSDERSPAHSYARLERYLAGLVKHVNKPPELARLDGRRAQRLLLATYVPDPAAYTEARLDPFTAAEARLTVDDREQVDLALAYLAWEFLRDEGRILVPADVRKAESAREHWLEAVRHTRGPARLARDRELKRLARVEGWQVPALSARFGLSRRQVQEILYGRSVA